MTNELHDGERREDAGDNRSRSVERLRDYARNLFSIADAMAHSGLREFSHGDCSFRIVPSVEDPLGHIIIQSPFSGIEGDAPRWVELRPATRHVLINGRRITDDEDDISLRRDADVIEGVLFHLSEANALHVMGTLAKARKMTPEAIGRVMDDRNASFPSPEESRELAVSQLQQTLNDVLDDRSLGGAPVALNSETATIVVHSRDDEGLHFTFNDRSAGFWREVNVLDDGRVTASDGQEISTEGLEELRHELEEAHIRGRQESRQAA
jgi:hypothetical protein